MSGYAIRVAMPYHLRNLANIGEEIRIDVASPVTPDSVVDAIELSYPMLCGTIRDHATRKRRPLLRYFVCEKDISHEPTDNLLPDAVLSGAEPFIIWGAVAGG